jgi:hypothetical protein
MSDDVKPKERLQRKVRARRVDLDLIQKRLQTALNEDSKWLLLSAANGKLNKNGVDSIEKYLKLIKILKTMDSEIPLEELEKLANKDAPPAKT